MLRFDGAGGTSGAVLGAGQAPLSRGEEPGMGIHRPRRPGVAMQLLPLLAWALLPGKAGPELPETRSGPGGRPRRVGRARRQQHHSRGFVCVRRLLGGKGTRHRAGSPGGVPLGDL